LSRNPEAPASIARRRYPGRPNVVRIRTRQGAAQLRQRLETGRTRHLDVEQGDIGVDGLRGGEHLIAARDLRDHLDVGLQAE
jgi:hypothetical protein